MGSSCSKLVGRNNNHSHNNKNIFLQNSFTSSFCSSSHTICFASPTSSSSCIFPRRTMSTSKSNSNSFIRTLSTTGSGEISHRDNESRKYTFNLNNFNDMGSFTPSRIATGLCKSPYSLDANNIDKDQEEINRSVYKPGDTIYPVVPRAAVAVTVCRYKDDMKNKILYEKIGHLLKDPKHRPNPPEFYKELDQLSLSLNNPEELEMLVIQRGKEPAKYKWSLVGGSVEVGEDSLLSAKREVEEETGLSKTNLLFNPFSYTTTDAIFKDEEGKIIFHYVIAQYMSLLLGSKEWSENQVKANDDAIDHQWVSFYELPTLDLGSSTMVTTVNKQLSGLFERKFITIESILESTALYQDEI